ncbi:MAG: S8 family serine peptidase [Myxococcota bacterium]
MPLLFTLAALAAPRPETPIAYQRVATHHADGRVTIEETGSLLFKDADGLGMIDTSTLSDTRGRAYSEMLGATQESEESPLVTTYTVYRNPKRDTVEDPLEALSEELPDVPRKVHAEAIRTSHLLPEVPFVMSPRVEEALACSRCEPLPVLIELRDPTDLVLPRPTSDLEALAPDLALDLKADRLEALERHWTENEQRQAAFLKDLRAIGGEDARTAPLGNFAIVTADAQVLAWLVDHPDVASLFEELPKVLTANTGTEIRAGAQIDPFLAGNYNGEWGSVTNTFGDDILIAITDESIDHDHPAWRDGGTSSASRLREVDCYSSSGFSPNNPTCWASIAPSGQRTHGTIVTGQAAADLTQDQAGFYSTSWENQRTGMSPESSLVFIQAIPLGSGPYPSSIGIVNQALATGADILNASWSTPTPLCPLTYSSDWAVDTAHLNGIFFVTSAGNDGNNGGNCNLSHPATASGAFTVGALDKYAWYPSAPLASYSSRGGGAHDRRMVDLVTIGGRTGANATYDNAFGAGGPTQVGTSYAAPVVSGAAANYKHFLVSAFGSGPTNQPGVLNAHMLLMGDGTRYDTFIDTNRDVDPRTGTGRMKMRLFTPEGMDFPWAFHSWRSEVSNGDSIVLPAVGASTEVDSEGTTMSSDVDLLDMAAYWYEPNAETWESPAVIDIDLMRNGVVSTDGVPSPGIARAADGTLGGTSAAIRVRGLNVPASTRAHGSVSYGEQSREVVVAWFYEDRDRDDANGPTTAIH